ncbi:PilZ domain-containing protein [Sphingomonas sp. FW199]
MRTAGQGRFGAVLQDLSVAGCRIVTSTPMHVGERVFVRLPGFQAFVGEIVWIENGQAGVLFDVALHPAVVDHICQPTTRR